MGRAVGIDLGTTNSCVAVFAGAGDPQVIPGADGARTVPSVVAFAASGERLVGSPARRQSVMNPLSTLASVKRLMGLRPEDVTEADQEQFPQLRVDEGAVRFMIDGRAYAPEEISAAILASIAAQAGEFLGEPVTDAVITVPAYFNDAQRQATKDAGRIAGLNVLRIINEPTAAALAYGLDKEHDQTILVFDLGGGTFDVSVLEIGDGVFEVQATAGDNHLGGDDFDRAIVAWLNDELAAQGADVSEDAQAQQRLLEAAEKAKRELSGLPVADIQLPFLSQDEAGAPVHYAGELSRAQFERLAAPLIRRLAGPVRQVMEDAGLSAGDIDHLVLVGGMTRMPAVQDQVRTLTGLEPTKSVNPDEVVALGAAIQAHVLTGAEAGLVLLDVTPLSLGIETRGGLFNRLIERNTTIPARAAQVFTTAEDDQPSVEIHVLQGERDMAADNRSVGRLQLLGIMPAPRGVPQIEVNFEIDADGILSVRALDLGTGNTQEARMEDHAGLDDVALERMITDARDNAERDARQRRAAELRNRADSLIYSAEDTARRVGDRLTPELRDRILDGIALVRAALHGGAQLDDLARACDELTGASYEAADLLYRGSAPAIDEDPPHAVTQVRVVDEDDPRFAFDDEDGDDEDGDDEDDDDGDGDGEDGDGDEDGDNGADPDGEGPAEGSVRDDVGGPGRGEEPGGGNRP